MRRGNGLLIAGLALVPACMLFGQGPKTVLEAVYTKAQAERGHAEYDRSCARCHGEGLDGGGQAPALHSSSFLEVWREDYLSSVYQYARVNMPPGNRKGTLRDEQYVDIVAYILAVNEFPAGQAELNRAALETTLLVGPDGPKPLPPSSTVRVVGCLARAKDEWMLMRSSEPARTRDAEETSQDELAASAQRALANRSYRLSSVEDVKPDSALQPQIGHKMQVKGVLNGEGANSRIHVLSIEGVDGKGCE